MNAFQYPQGAPLSDATPEELGSAAAGTAGEAARGDHVHPMPSAADVGADPAGAAAAAQAASQPLDVDLTAIAGLSSAADRVPYATGAGAWALAVFTLAARTFVAAVDAAAQRTALGLGALATKSAAVLTGAADVTGKLPFANLADAVVSGHVLTWNGSAWAPAAPGGGVTGSGAANQAAYWSGTSALAGEAQLAASRGGLGIDTSGAANGQTNIHTGSVWGLAMFPSGDSGRHIGTSPIEAWVGAYGISSTTNSTQPGTGAIRAMRFVVTRTTTIDRIGVDVAGTVANAVARCGIYACGANGYPSSLIVDSTEMAVSSAALRNATISVVLAPGVYWLVYLGGVANANLRTVNLALIQNYENTGGVALRIGLTVAQAYGDLPSTFPAGAAAMTNNNQYPIVLVRCAS